MYSVTLNKHAARNKVDFLTVAPEKKKLTFRKSSVFT